MKPLAIVGLGPIGAVLSAALAATGADLIGVERAEERREALAREGLKVTGFGAPPVRFGALVADVADLAARRPGVVVLATKASSQEPLLRALARIHEEGRRYVLAQNGLDNEVTAARFLGEGNVARMVLNFGAQNVAPDEVACGDLIGANLIGLRTEADAPWARSLAAQLSAGGLETAYVEDIRCRNWEKVFVNATVNGICALTGQSLAELVHCGATRDYLRRFVAEVLAVARAQGCDFPDAVVEETIERIRRAGDHLPSMAQDLAAGRPTEIAYLNGRISALGRSLGIPTPYNDTIALLVRGVEMHRGLCEGCTTACDKEGAAPCQRCPNLFD